ncbi:hypothetical protein QRX50_31490 [Amycolatopsis carbonis]|uniref:VRR-NUC domain-containing protein n=1 Tax=Amycolatopsis carbonis TaxID=715471 RepID=A0A9Y2MUK8_9PSEU|nr:hypothetical protein [Amycolatopsis sp. 2-15]WIX75984.1 hypothetical protein QRX50_31490 [Amycolatopsis sp. 2-15]
MASKVVYARGRKPAAPAKNARNRIAPMTEDQFQDRVMKTAKAYGWMVVHFRKAMRQSGKYSTPVQGDNGSPDLLLARNGVVLWAELKSDTGRLSPEQTEWRDAIGDGCWRLWRPRDWDTLVLPELAGGRVRAVVS